MKRNIFISLLVLFIFSMGMEVFAMSSAKYKIDTDSVNFGGTEDSTAGSLYLSDTFGEVGTGMSSSSKYSISAGYRMLQSSYISISAASDVFMPNMSGLSQNQSDSAESWVVKTDNAAGYELLVKSVTSPALKSVEGAFFSDYAPSVPSTADYLFNVPSADSVFAFSPEGQDISQKFLDNGPGNTCGVGIFDTSDRCWDGFSTSDKVIATRSSSNHPDGTMTTIKYRTAIGNNKIQDAGTYTSTIIITAVVL